MSVFSSFDSYPTSPMARIFADVDFDLIPIEGLSDTDYGVDRGAGDFLYRSLLIERPIVRRIASEFESTFQDDTTSLHVSNQKDLKDGSRMSDNIEGGANNGSLIGNLVDVFIGVPGEKRSDMKLIIQGIVDKTNSLDVTEESLTINVAPIIKTGVRLPSRVFSFTDYPQMDTNLEGKLIPYVFGNWSDKYNLQGYFIGANTFKICDHPITSVKDIMLLRDGKNGVFSFTVNTSLGEVTLNNYDHRSGDVLYVKVDGYPYAAGESASIPSRVIFALLDAGSFSRSFFGNSEEFDSLTNHISVRRYIDSEVLLEDLIQSLARDLGCSVSWRYGFDQSRSALFHVVPFKPWFGRFQLEVDGLKSYQDYDAIGDITELLDPNRLYANTIETEKVNITDLDETSRLKRETIQYSPLWIYLSNDIDSALRRELYRRIMRVKA